MTRIESMTTDDAYMLLFDLTGANPSRASAVAELIRHLVSGHSPWRYQSLLAEVTRLISPIREIDPEEIRYVVDALESDGDLVINGGAIHATPIRAIQLDSQSFRFMSSLPTKRLATLFPGDWSCQESMRSCQPGDPAQLGTLLRARGGVLLTAEGWAGLDYEPYADQDWLAHLEQRLETDAFPPESQVFSHKMSWQWLKYEGNALTWQKGPPPLNARIWRGINLRGYWVYALTASRSPIEMPWVKLARNDAHRAIFAFARSMAIPIPVKLEPMGTGEGEGGLLTLPPFLPYAEYRYLTALANGRQSSSSGVRWRLPATRVGATVRMLEDRLGIAFPMRQQAVTGNSGD
jgi:hypothetical protein